MIKVRVLFFAKARQLSGGISETTLELDVDHNNGILAEELLSTICAKYNLEVIKQSVILAVNEQYCENLQERLQLREGDEIAVIPPISGG